MPTDITGTVIDNRFRILSVLGTGSFGTVYKAQQMDLNRLVALKMLHGAALNIQTASARFEREVRLLAALQHDHIVHVYGCGLEANSQPYLSMEFVEGETLSQLLARSKTINWKRTVNIGIQVCSALAAAHAEGIIHRDISPRNIMLPADKDGDFVKVVDFGLSTVLPESDWTLQKLTQTGTVLGTVAYISPEASIGGKSDARSDIYSLGCVLYECLAGRAAFEGEHPAEVLSKHYLELPPPLSSIEGVEQFPPELELVIFKSLQREPEGRFPSAQAFADALALVRDGRSKEMDLSGVQLAVGVTSPDPAKNRPILFIALSAISVLIVACLIFYWQFKQRAAVYTETATVSPAIQKRTSDVKAANDLLSQARKEKLQGHFQQADALAREALLKIGHSYPDEIKSHAVSLEDLNILTQIAAIYDDGKLARLTPVKPMVNVNSIIDGVIHPRVTHTLEMREERYFLRIEAILMAIYGDYEHSARTFAVTVRELVAENNLPAARSVLSEQRDLIPPAKRSSPHIDLNMALAEAEVAALAGDRQQALLWASKVWKASSATEFEDESNHFLELAHIFVLEESLKDPKGLHRAFVEMEKSAFAVASSPYDGVDKARQLFISLERISAPYPQYAKRAHADLEKLSK